MFQPLTAIGVISGTSMDGIDVAVVTTDGEQQVVPGAGRTYPYEPGLRQELLALAANGAQVYQQPLAELEAAVAVAHAGAVLRFLAEAGVDRASVALVGLHGQTLYHNPAARITRQLGDPALVARILGLPVVAEFRHADVAAGGEGAPLVPLYHQALAAGLAAPLAVLNWGGVGNITWVRGEEVLAFDTGPASALLDDFVARRCGIPFDRDGALARTGSVDAAVLARLMADPFFQRPPPKSLDRQAFHARATAVEALSTADGAATLAAFTIAATAAALDHLPEPPRRWLVTGGGRRNGWFMERLATTVGVPVEPVESVGWDGDFLEAQCFAYLAVRATRGLPLSLPSTTGVPYPMPGGRLVPAP